MFEPQHTESSPSAWWIRTSGVINLICMATYLWWRCVRSLIGVNHIIWAYMFLVAECIMAIGMIVGHSSRSFPVHREKVRSVRSSGREAGAGRASEGVTSFLLQLLVLSRNQCTLHAMKQKQFLGWTVACIECGVASLFLSLSLRLRAFAKVEVNM